MRVRCVLALLAALALPAAASAATAGVRNGHVVVDGRPFFPIMQWLQCPSLFPQNAAMGIDVFLGKGCEGTSDADELAATAAAGAWSVLPAGSTATGASLLGWHFEDEPDQSKIWPDTIARIRSMISPRTTEDAEEKLRIQKKIRKLFPRCFL